MNYERHFQTVTLRFVNGQKATFTGPVAVTDDHPLPISEITFSRPLPLPDDMHFEMLVGADASSPSANTEPTMPTPNSDTINEAIVDLLLNRSLSTTDIAERLQTRLSIKISAGAVRKRLYRLASFGFVDSTGQGSSMRWTAVK